MKKWISRAPTTLPANRTSASPAWPGVAFWAILLGMASSTAGPLVMYLCNDAATPFPAVVTWLRAIGLDAVDANWVAYTVHVRGQGPIAPCHVADPTTLARPVLERSLKAAGLSLMLRYGEQSRP